MYRTVLWTLWERERVGGFGRMALKHVKCHKKNILKKEQSSMGAQGPVHHVFSGSRGQANPSVPKTVLEALEVPRPRNSPVLGKPGLFVPLLVW